MISDDIQKGLETQARLVTERMPTEMTELNARQKAKALKDFMDERKLSQAFVAKQIGVSTGVISSFLKGDYKGDVAKVIKKVVDLINSVTSRERRIRNKPYIETTVAKCIADLIAQTIAFSEDEGKIGIVSGEGGVNNDYGTVYQGGVAHYFAGVQDKGGDSPAFESD